MSDLELVKEWTDRAERLFADAHDLKLRMMGTAPDRPKIGKAHLWEFYMQIAAAKDGCEWILQEILKIADTNSLKLLDDK